jgi:hypothetical protein
VLTIPYRRICVRSNLPPQELIRRLKLVTRKGWWTVWSQADARFVGSITDSGFCLAYVPEGRNTYAPWLVGCVRQDGDGSTMELRMTLHPIAVMGTIGIACFPLWWWGLDGTALLWLGVMAGFHVVMYYVGFKADAWHAESLLHDLARQAHT